MHRRRVTPPPPVTDAEVTPPPQPPPTARRRRHPGDAGGRRTAEASAGSGVAWSWLQVPSTHLCWASPLCRRCRRPRGGLRRPHSPTGRGEESQSGERGGGETAYVRVTMEGLLRRWHFESRTIKKAEHQRIDAFELWCWRRLLTVPWTARRSNQSILKEISPGCSWKD